MNKHIQRLKSISNWHYDPRKKPDGNEFTFIKSYDINFQPFIEECKLGSIPETWDTANKFWEQSRINFYKDTARNGGNINEYSQMIKGILKEIGEDPNRQMFDRIDVTDHPIATMIMEDLGYNKQKTSVKFHNQRPGQILHWHLDKFSGEDSVNMTRCAVMLADWKWGQIWQFGNAFFSGWRAGDVITWDITNMPHATGNIGLWDRPMLQVTGCKL